MNYKGEGGGVMVKVRILGPHCNENSSHFTDRWNSIFGLVSVDVFVGILWWKKLPFADHHLPQPSPTLLSDLRTRESQRVSSTRRINVLEKLDVRSSQFNVRPNMISSLLWYDFWQSHIGNIPITSPIGGNVVEPKSIQIFFHRHQETMSVSQNNLNDFVK